MLALVEDRIRAKVYYVETVEETQDKGLKRA